ncbi:MAG: MBL fold metallo-hydrolase [Treponema sp.]|nr:MBL fold metallo-hydrolase [Treponema sp.]
MKDIHIIRSGFLSVNSLVVPVCGNKVFVVDPAASASSRDSGKIVNYLKEKKLECIAVILTHTHFDHVTGIAEIKEAFPAAVVAVHEAEKKELDHGPGPMNISILGSFGMNQILEEISKQPLPDFLLKDQLTLDNLFKKVDVVKMPAFAEIKKEISQWTVIHTPGHSPGSICIYNEAEKVLISGDTWFDGAYGRTDMYGGDEDTLQQSLSKVWKIVKSGTMVYPGHDMHFKTS